MTKIQLENHEILPKFPKNIQSFNYQLYPLNINCIINPMAPVDRRGPLNGCSSFNLFTPIIGGFMDVSLIAKSFSFM